MIDDNPDRQRIKKIGLFLRITVRALLKAQPVPKVQPPDPIELTKEEQEAINKRMGEFHEHDR